MFGSRSREGAVDFRLVLPCFVSPRVQSPRREIRGFGGRQLSVASLVVIVGLNEVRRIGVLLSVRLERLYCISSLILFWSS